MRIAADTDLTLTTGKPALVNDLTNPEIIRCDQGMRDCVWRRGGDSNPRQDIILNTLSRRAT